MELTEESSASLRREELYALVWAEPMLKVAARFGVSSSYMARVCSQLQVPRPELEMSEEVEVRYVHGSYVRESEYVPSKRSRYAQDTTWTTKKHFGSGRLCLQAYSPYHSADWAHRWREKEPGELIAMIPAICSELERSAHFVAKLVEEGERRAEIERRRWEEERARYERERAEQRAQKAREESKADLLAIIRQWADSENFQRFFEDVERRASSLDEATRQQLESQLASMRALFPKWTHWRDF